jgi:hypothetical protein
LQLRPRRKRPCDHRAAKTRNGMGDEVDRVQMTLAFVSAAGMSVTGRKLTNHHGQKLCQKLQSVQ